MAGLVGADPKEIIWTSGATESNNIAVKGVGRFYKGKKKHVVTTQTEHKWVFPPVKFMKWENIAKNLKNESFILQVCAGQLQNSGEWGYWCDIPPCSAQVPLYCIKSIIFFLKENNNQTYGRDPFYESIFLDYNILPSGLIDLEQFEAALRPDTSLVMKHYIFLVDQY